MLLFGILLGVVSIAALADVVNFPDPQLEAAIRDAIGKPTGDIQDSDLIGLATLDAGSRRIVNLEGIEHCVDLKELLLNNNWIVEIGPLSSLTGLTMLHLHANTIADIAPLHCVRLACPGDNL